MNARRNRTQKVVVATSVVPPPEMVRLGAEVKEHFVTLKRRTGVQHSNVLCRWALCRSLAEPIAPSNPPALDSAVEMTWKVFSGAAGDLYWWLLRMRCHEFGLAVDDATLQLQLRAHIARGAAYLVGDAALRNATSLATLAFVPGASVAERASG